MHIAAALAGLGLLLLAALGPAQAATVYRRVDDQGRTHYAERVPEKYLQAATPLPANTSNPSDAQQQDAQERAARDKTRASAVGKAASNPKAALQPRPAASTPLARRPAQVPDAQTDRATWAHLYQESLDCFGPYRTTRGATRAEAFDHCTAVDGPPSRCR